MVQYYRRKLGLRQTVEYFPAPPRTFRGIAGYINATPENRRGTYPKNVRDFPRTKQ